MPRPDDLHVGLVHVFLVDEVDAGLGSLERVVARRQGLDRRQGSRMRRAPGFHGRGIEIAADADDQLALEGAVVPGLQIGHRDRADGGQLRLARVGAVGAIDQLGRFAARDAVLIVVAAHDARGLLLLRQLQLFRVEFGWRSKSMASEKTWSASPFSESHESAVESSSPPVSMCAALASSRSSMASPSILAVPLVRQACP